MAYFDFVNSGSSIGYGLVSQGYKYYINDYGYSNTEYTETLTASGDTIYRIVVPLSSGGTAYVPYCKVEMNGTELCNLTGTSGKPDTSPEWKTSEVYVKSGDTLTIKKKTGLTSNTYIWISQ